MLFLNLKIQFEFVFYKFLLFPIKIFYNYNLILLKYKLILNTDDKSFSGEGRVVKRDIISEPIQMHSLSQSAEFSLPPLSVLYYEYKPTAKRGRKKGS